MKKIPACVFSLAGIVFLGFSRRALLTGYASLFSVHNAMPGADALVVLGGRIETRFPCALELYRQGYAPGILLTDIRPYTFGIPDFNCSARGIALGPARSSRTPRPGSRSAVAQRNRSDFNL